MEHTLAAMESSLLPSAPERLRPQAAGLALRAQLGAARAGHARARRGPAPQTSASLYSFWVLAASLGAPSASCLAKACFGPVPGEVGRDVRPMGSRAARASASTGKTRRRGGLRLERS